MYYDPNLLTASILLPSIMVLVAIVKWWGDD